MLPRALAVALDICLADCVLCNIDCIADALPDIRFDFAYSSFASLATADFWFVANSMAALIALACRLLSA